MRRSRWVVLIVVCALLAGALAWGWSNFAQIECQWACYRVGAAPTFEQAQAHIGWFERPGAPASFREELVAKWGTGNQRFDFYLARYLGEPACSHALRSAFARHVGRRQELLRRWAHWWAWRAPLEPNEQVASVLDYHQTLAAAPDAERITWREVLDLQAVFCLTGQAERARDLSPDNWAEHYRVWRETRAELPEIARPDTPLPDWQGPVLARP